MVIRECALSIPGWDHKLACATHAYCGHLFQRIFAIRDTISSWHFLGPEVAMTFDLAAGLIVALVSCVGGLVWLVREAKGRKRCERMEAYLRLERKVGLDRGRRSTKQIMTALGITSGQVMDAARRSRAIKRLAIVENVNSAESAVFECAPY